MTRALATLALVGLAAGVFAADTAPAPRPVAPKPLPWKIADTQEVVVLTPTRPVRVRLAVQVEGKAVGEMWRDKLKVAFNRFDRDKNGVLGEKEVQSIFSDAGMSLMLQNGFYQVTPQDRPSLERLDADRNGSVSLDEYLGYYKNSTAALLRPQPPQPENPTGAAVTEALFKLMDANDDGKLTKDEVRAVEKLLATKDADEDECLAQNELVDFNNPRGVRPVPVVVRGGQPAQPANPAAEMVLTYDPARVPGTLTQQVIKKYDTDGDFDLTRDEVGFDDRTFARLDRDGNGKLDGEELDAWRTGEPDLEVHLSLAPKAVDCVAKLVTPRADANDRGFVVTQVEPGRLVVRTGRQPIEFWAYAAVLNSRQGQLKTQYAYLFTQAAGDKDHVLDKDLTGQNAVRFQFLRTLFDPADADGDGKLTRAEFDAYFDLQDSFRNVALAVTPAVQTPTLFQLLDENRDGRLGVRELRTAWDRLRPLEPGGGEVVTRAAIQPSVSLRLTRSAERFLANQVIDPRFQNPNQVQVPQKGPVWFRKMDRNADGDVSRSEFLGTRAEFEAMDADGDALISLEEAEAWDRKMRPAGGK